GLKSIWWLVAPIWVIGLVGGGLHVIAAVLLAVTCGVYAAFAVNLGLWFSARSSSTVRAAVGTLLGLVAVTAVPSALHVFFFAATAFVPFSNALAALDSWQSVAFNPPVALWTVAFYSDDLFQPSGAGAPEVSAALVGLPAYALSAYGLFRSTCSALGADGARAQE